MMTCPSSPPVTTVQPSLDTSMQRMAPGKVEIENTTVLQISKFTHRVKRGLVPLRVLRYYAEKQK